jgi:uncharacterized protein
MSSTATAQVANTYQQEIKTWDSQRIKDLTAENGWINLVGLLWLQEGHNSFGSGKQNDIVFPKGTITKAAGYFERKGDIVKMVAENNTVLKVNGVPVNEAVIFHPDSILRPVVAYDNLRWTIIKRGDKMGIRLRNLKSDALKKFKGIERYEVDSNWRINAVLKSTGLPTTIAITNVLGQTSQLPTAGKLEFAINGQSYSLDALTEGDELFIIFGDLTNGKGTYPSGRFINTAKPGPDGKVVLDFNKAYNPPCAFTSFATCPLPPVQNRMSVAVTAGEKFNGH